MILALAVVGLIAVAVVASKRVTRNDGQRAPVAPLEGAPAQPGRRRVTIDADTLGRWVADGLLSAEQADAILEHERKATPAYATRTVRTSGRERRLPVFAEALGYLGGVLALAGLTLLVANYWRDLSTPIRLTLTFLTALLLAGAGALVHERADPALARLRWFLWTLSSATAAVFTAVLMVDTVDVVTDSLTVAACSATVAVTSGVFWSWRDRPLQELLFIAAVIVSAAAGAETAANIGVAGLAVWLLGSVVLAAGLRDSTPRPIIPHAVGAAAIMIGAIVTVAQWRGGGLLFTTATAAGLLLLAAMPQLTMDGVKRSALLVIGGLGALQCIPQTLGHFSEEAGGATGLVTWAMAGLTMAAGARRLLRAPTVAETIGGLGLIGGAALTGTQWSSFAPMFGLGTALTLLVIGVLPGRALFMLVGLLGLLINVPWVITTFFPGEGRAPLLILVSGALIVAVAVLLARQSDRLRTELMPHPPDEIPVTSPSVIRSPQPERAK
jgi:hypothetical protein